MARKSDNELKDMTLNQLEVYAEEHPKEALRVVKACAKTGVYAGSIAGLQAKATAFDLLASITTPRKPATN